MGGSFRWIALGVGAVLIFGGLVLAWRSSSARHDEMTASALVKPIVERPKAPEKPVSSAPVHPAPMQAQPVQAAEPADDKPEIASVSSPGTGAVSGVVRDIQTGKPAAGVVISACPEGGGMLSESKPSTPDGKFLIDGLDAGRYNLGVSGSGDFAPSKSKVGTTVAVEANKTRDGIEIGVVAGTRIRFKVVNAAHAPVAMAMVSLKYGDVGEALSTQEDGTAGFEAIPLTESVTASARKSGEISDSFGPVSVADASKSEITLVLGPGGSVAGRVVDGANHAIPGAFVVAQLSGGKIGLDDIQAKADATGAFTIKGLGNGSYDLFAERPDNVPAPKINHLLDAGTLRKMVQEEMATEAGLKPSEQEIEKMIQQFQSNPQVELEDSQHFFPTGESLAHVGLEPKQHLTGIVLKLGGKSAEETVIVAGRVVDAEGRPIEKAEVRLMGDTVYSKTTDKNGLFSFDTVPEDNSIYLSILHPDYAEIELMEVKSGDLNVVVTLNHFGKICGRVLDEKTGIPLNHFRVGFSRGHLSGDSIWETHSGSAIHVKPSNMDSVSDPAGEFELDQVDPGEVTVFATADGYAVGHTTVDDVPGNRTREGVVIRLGPSANITGKVTNDAGNPIGGAKISVVSADHEFGGTADEFFDPDVMTAPDGTFVLNTVLSGDYKIIVFHPSYASAEFPVPRDGKNFNPRLTVGGSIRVAVTRDGTAYPGAEIYVSRSIPLGGITAAHGTSDRSGTFVTQHLTPGDYSVGAHTGSSFRRDPGSLSGSEAITVEEGKDVSVEVKLVPKQDELIGAASGSVPDVLPPANVDGSAPTDNP